MADRPAPASSATAPKPIWLRQAEEAKLKSEAEKTAAAKAAFEATFKAVEKPREDEDEDGDEENSDDPDGDGREDLSSKPLGPVDPSKCSAAGTGVAGGTAGAPTTFVVITKDSDGRKIPSGGATVTVKISPGVGVGGSDLEGMVKDIGDGSYSVTYAVPKRGNYMVHVECNGKQIMGSPFPVFFSTGSVIGTASFPTAASPYPNLVNQTMPNMPNYAGSVSGAFPGLLGMIPGMASGPSGGVVLQGVGVHLGEICREFLNGKCTKTDCKLNHPPQNLLMSVLTATSTMGTLSQAPMAPSAAAMAAAQAIMAAQVLQAHATQAQSSGDASGSPDKASKADALKKTVQVSNLSPLLTVDHLKQLFGYCGTVVDCTIADSKHFAYIEYAKQEEATAALALNNIDVGGRPINVEMAKSLPSKTSLVNPSLPLMMQQAVALQTMQFQQALVMQQTIASQQAAARAATMKSATEMAAARAAEISKKLKAEGVGGEDKEAKTKSRSPSPAPRRSKSRSRSPVRSRRSRRSRSFSPAARYTRDHRLRSPVRSHHSRYGSERSLRGSERSSRDDQDSYGRGERRESDRPRDHYSSSSRRNRNRSASPRNKKPSRADSRSPVRRRESLSPRTRRSSRASSRSPRHHKGSRASPAQDHRTSSHRSKHSRSRSPERKHHHTSKEDTKKSEKLEAPRSSDRKKGGGKDAHHTRELKDDRKVESSDGAHKRNSVLSDEEALEIENTGRHKKSKMDGNSETSDLEMNEDKRCLHSPMSKSHKRSLMDDDDEDHHRSRDSARYDKAKSGHKKRDRKDTASRERNSSPSELRHSKDDKRASHHSSSRSHRSSYHSRERSSYNTADRHKQEKRKEDGVKPHDVDINPKDSCFSDKKQVINLDSPNLKIDKSNDDLAIEGTLRDLVDSKQEKDFDEGNEHLAADSSAKNEEYSDALSDGCIFDQKLNIHRASENHGTSAVEMGHDSKCKDAELESENLDVFNNITKKDYINQDLEDIRDNEPPEASDKMAQPGQGSIYIEDEVLLAGKEPIIQEANCFLDECDGSREHQSSMEFLKRLNSHGPDSNNNKDMEHELYSSDHNVLPQIDPITGARCYTAKELQDNELNNISTSMTDDCIFPLKQAEVMNSGEEAQEENKEYASYSDSIGNGLSSLTHDPTTLTGDMDLSHPELTGAWKAVEELQLQLE